MPRHTNKGGSHQARKRPTPKIKRARLSRLTAKDSAYVAEIERLRAVVTDLEEKLHTEYVNRPEGYQEF